MAKVNLNNSAQRKRPKTRWDTPQNKRKDISEKNNNSKFNFKSKHRLSKGAKSKNAENSEKKKRRRSREGKSSKKKRTERFPSFLDNCELVSETTLIDISDDSCTITASDLTFKTPKKRAGDGENATTVIPNGSTPRSTRGGGGKARYCFRNVLKNADTNLNYCSPLIDNVVTKEFLPLSVKKGNEVKVTQSEPLHDVVYISDSDESFSVKEAPKRRSTRRREFSNSDLSESVTFIDETVIAKTVLNRRKKLSSEELKGSKPKLRKVVTNDISLSPIPMPSSRKNKKSAPTKTRKKVNKELIDESSLERLAQLNKILTANPDLPNILKKLEGTNGNNLRDVNVPLDDSDCANPDKTYSSSGQFISDNIYHVKKVKRKGLRPIVIDGSNIAMGHSIGRFFSVKGLKICIDYFVSKGHRVYAFIPSYRLKRNQSSDQALLMELVKKEHVFCTASRDVLGHKICSYDDRILVQVAAAMAAVIVSGDNYRDLMTEDRRLVPVIKNNLLTPTWVGDMLVFPDDPLGRSGPTLRAFLRY